MFPLFQAKESNPTMGGYDFGEWSTYSGQFHPGLDFNAGSGGDGDIGMSLVTVCKSVLRASEETTRGYGKHQWWEIVEGPHVGSWVHYCHANSFVHQKLELFPIVEKQLASVENPVDNSLLICILKSRKKNLRIGDIGAED